MCCFAISQRAHIPRSLLQILEKDGKKDEKKPKVEKPDKEQIDPEDDDESTKDDRSPKQTRSHSRESLKDKRKSRRSRSRSRSPRKKREKSAGEESASEGEINWKSMEERWLDGMRSWVNLVVQEDYEYLSQVFLHLQEETVIRGARRIRWNRTLVWPALVERRQSSRQSLRHFTIPRINLKMLPSS